MKLKVLPGRAMYHGGSLCKEGAIVDVDHDAGCRLVADEVAEEIKPAPKPKPKAKAKKAD